MHEEYSDTLCPKGEKCGAWNVTSHWDSGCILDKYCNLNGTWEGTDVNFQCVNGEQPEDPSRLRFAVIFNLNSMDNDQYSHGFHVTNNTDILIEGDERKGTGYQWMFRGTDCKNQVVVGGVTKNDITKRREFPFKTVPEAVHGTECSVNFAFM